MPTNKGELVFGTSPAIRRVLEDCADFASSHYPILLTGESGTGKSWLAKHLHVLSRRPGSFVEAPVPQLEELTQGQLRGNTEGAYTDAKRARHGVLQSANRGTLFLDEVGTASARLQAVLLTVVESGEVVALGAERPVPVDVRMIFASNEPLLDQHHGRFRMDLYHRMGRLTIHVPPLRERREDIPELAIALLRRITRDHGRAEPLLSPSAIAKLQEAEWPGNLRELESVLVRAFLRLHGRSSIDADQIELSSHDSRREAPAQELTKDLLRRTLATNRGNLARSARSLGIDERTFRRKVRNALGPRAEWHLDLGCPGHDRDTSVPTGPAYDHPERRAAS